MSSAPSWDRFKRPDRSGRPQRSDRTPTDGADREAGLDALANAEAFLDHVIGIDLDGAAAGRAEHQLGELATVWVQSDAVDRLRRDAFVIVAELAECCDQRGTSAFFHPRPFGTGSGHETAARASADHRLARVRDR